jgi:hypothetical protein
MIAPRKRMAFFANYLPEKTYGLLGLQFAATIIQENTGYECVVIAVTRGAEKGTGGLFCGWEADCWLLNPERPR